MPTLYAWNTARASPVAYPNVRPARLFHPTRGRQFFGLFRYTSPPTRRYALKVYYQRLFRHKFKIPPLKVLPCAVLLLLYFDQGLIGIFAKKEPSIQQGRDDFDPFPLESLETLHDIIGCQGQMVGPRVSQMVG
ncbi:MAG: hypothetical protein BECKG1743F_GA0114225_102545 [Candidatus Kentron sp. G]|nr:MAG: hypothetical protein BECKG1743F_GA0114225_102545 [Candidatus Kentron sp. G]VFN06226.1 MAG: hypothetical protein BECKG1743E_GA0114224_109832 [Candidatus Kentron sp. G]